MDASQNTIFDKNGGIHALKNTPTVQPNSTDGTYKHSIREFNGVSSARVHIYYVQFSDNTTWGLEDISIEQTFQYGKSYLIEQDLSEYYTNECEVSLSYVRDGTCIVLNEIWLTFINNSEKKIVAFESVLIQYNVYGEKLIQTSKGSPYGKITRSPTDFIIDKTDFVSLSAYRNTSYAELYIYYILYEDQTSWGYKTNMTGELAVQYGTKFKIERTL